METEAGDREGPAEVDEGQEGPPEVEGHLELLVGIHLE